MENVSEFQNRTVPLYKNFCFENFYLKCYVWLEFRHVKLRTKNNILFHGEAKYVRKQTRADKNGYCANPPFKIILFKTSHLRVLLRLRRNYFWWLVETLAAQLLCLRCPSLIILLRDVRYQYDL